MVNRNIPQSLAPSRWLGKIQYFITFYPKMSKFLFRREHSLRCQKGGRVRATGQRLRALAALAEDQSLSAPTPGDSTACNSSSGEPNILFWSLRTSRCTCVYQRACHAHTHTKIIKKSLKKVVSGFSVCNSKNGKGRHHSRLAVHTAFQMFFWKDKQPKRIRPRPSLFIFTLPLKAS